MKKKLLFRMLIAYLVFFVAAYIIIALCTQHMNPFEL